MGRLRPFYESASLASPLREQQAAQTALSVLCYLSSVPVRSRHLPCLPPQVRTGERSVFMVRVRNERRGGQTDLSISLFPPPQPYRRSFRSCAMTCCSDFLARMDSASRPLCH